MGRGRILRVDWELLATAFSEVPSGELERRAAARGAEILERADRGARRASPHEQEREDLARKAAGVAVMRFELVSQRDRFARARALEQETYEQHLRLDKDVVPPLKLEAKRLRAELRSLETRARDLGIDVGEIEPSIDWPNTIAVDAYEAPRYETNAERRKTAVEFFRRIGGG
jgi:hypothetical protein